MLVGPGSVVATLVLAGDAKPAITGADLLGISFAFGLIITALVYALGKVSGCHINPAVTFALAATKRFPWRELPAYWAAQVVGAVLGALAIWACSPRPASTSAWARPRSTRTRRRGRSAIFAEGIGTFMLMFAILGIVDARSPGDFAGLVIGGVVVAIIMVVGPITGAVAEPGARVRARAGLRARRRRDPLGPAAARLHPARAASAPASPRSSTTSSRRRASSRRPIKAAVTHPDHRRPRGRQVREDPRWPPRTQTMRKLLNDPEQVVKESLAGLAAAHGDILRVDADAQIVVRAGAPARGQGRARLRRRLGPRAAARRLRRARHARRGLPGRGVHLAGARPDARRDQGRRRRRRRRAPGQELHGRRHELQAGGRGRRRRGDRASSPC